MARNAMALIAFHLETWHFVHVFVVYACESMQNQCSLLVVGYHAFDMQKVEQTQITYIKLHAHTHKIIQRKKTHRIDMTMSGDSSTSVTQCIQNICCVKCYGAMLVCRLIENSKIELRLHEWYGRLAGWLVGWFEAHEKLKCMYACMLFATCQKSHCRLLSWCCAYTWFYERLLLLLLLYEKSTITHFHHISPHILPIC